MTRPWLSGNRTVLVMGMVPAAIFVALLLYFTGWAITFSFTNLELFGRRSIDWDWVGLQNYERLFTRRGFLDFAICHNCFLLFLSPNRAICSGFFTCIHDAWREIPIAHRDRSLPYAWVADP